MHGQRGILDRKIDVFTSDIFYLHLIIKIFQETLSAPSWKPWHQRSEGGRGGGKGVSNSNRWELELNLVHQEIESAPTRLHGILISGLKDKQLEELRYFCRHPQCDFSGEPMDRLIEPNTKEGKEEARQRECISTL
jgi:hypothetical protein